MGPRKIKLTPGPKDEYGNRFAAISVCSCGHEAQLPHEWVKLAANNDFGLQSLRSRLRCTKCGGRMPRIEVYRVADG